MIINKCYADHYLLFLRCLRSSRCIAISLTRRTAPRTFTFTAALIPLPFDEVMSNEPFSVFTREFMFERVYELANKSIQERSERMLTQMFEYFTKHVDKLPKSYLRLLDRDGEERVVCDYLSGMTDRYAIGVFESLFIPSTFSLGGIQS